MKYYSGDQTEKNEMGRACRRIGERTGVYRVWWGNLRETDHMEDTGVDGKKILRWIFRKWDGVHGLDRSRSGQEQVAGTCKCGSEPAGNLLTS